MKRLFFALVVLLGLSCCDNKDETLPTCEFSDPLEDLVWLKEIKASLNNCEIEISIFQAKYKNRVVFYKAITDPLVNAIPNTTLWNCEGKDVRTFEFHRSETFEKLVTNRIVLYRCKGSLEE